MAATYTCVLCYRCIAFRWSNDIKSRQYYGYNSLRNGDTQGSRRSTSPGYRSKPLQEDFLLDRIEKAGCPRAM